MVSYPTRTVKGTQLVRAENYTQLIQISVYDDGGRGRRSPGTVGSRVFVMIWRHLIMALSALRLGTANLALAIAIARETPRRKVFRWVRIVAMLFVTLSSRFRRSRSGS